LQSDWITLGESIFNYGGLGLVSVAFIFHILAMVGILNDINIIIFDWVMGLAYPLTIGTALIMWIFALDDSYVQFGYDKLFVSSNS
jgi:hypothetical protein